MAEYKLNTREIEALLEELRKEQDDPDKKAEYNRMRLALKQMLEQAVTAAKGALGDAKSALEFAPEHLKEEYEEKRAEAQKRLDVLTAQYDEAKEKYAF